ncbi:MAG: hypothetical protein GF416_04735 [Candidatus Altiarchaeales archaeon]|nr:hypothetical protein [Candidatus Altiarchaeales archaeon]MBD3416426.1 hypothetical protein [Candidatus Altiarchaeales archaeon]
MKGKGYFLKQLTAQTRIRSVDVGREMEGSTPPSVFIGSWNYPKVYAGPMMAAEHEATEIYDSPEEWVPGGYEQDEIINYRVNLVRGKRELDVTDVEDRLAVKLQETALSKRSSMGEVKFRNQPRGLRLSDEHTPHGPSAFLEEYRVEEGSWDRDLEKAYYDTDLKAKEAILDLHRRETHFSKMQKALSVGAFGLKRNRRMVPTRWSITACDSTIGNHLLEEVRQNDILDCYRVYGHQSLNNSYQVILLPTAWQYEWTESFIKVLGGRTHTFGDHETNLGKRGYSCVGGCYYSCKMAVLEQLHREKIQAGAIILREAYPGYVPLGVFNVRENVRAAVKGKPTEHNTLIEALDQALGKLTLPIETYERESLLLRENLHNVQTSLSMFT